MQRVYVRIPYLELNAGMVFQCLIQAVIWPPRDSSPTTRELASFISRTTRSTASCGRGGPRFGGEPPRFREAVTEIAKGRRLCDLHRPVDEFGVPLAIKVDDGARVFVFISLQH